MTMIKKKKRRVLMANSTVEPIIEPRRVKPKTYRQAPTHWLKACARLVISQIK